MGEIEKINIKNNIDLKDLSPEYKKLFNENIKLLNSGKENIFKKLNQEIFGITGFEKNNYSLLNNSSEEIANLCEKHNEKNKFLNICKQNLPVYLA